MNFNKVIVAGRLTDAPKWRDAEVPVVNFSVAYNRRRKDATDDTSFFNCKAFGKTAEFVQKYFGKGSSIMIEGSLRQETWTDKNGEKRSGVVIMVDQAHFTGARADGADQAPRHDAPVQPRVAVEPEFPEPNPSTGPAAKDEDYYPF